MKKDLTVFFSLLANPNSTNEELSVYIENKFDLKIDSTNVSRRVNKLFKTGIVNSVQGQIDSYKLDLERDFYIVEVDDTRWKSNNETVKEYFISHPYLSFFNTVHGTYKGYYAEFYIPRKGSVRKLIKAQFQLLKTKKIIKSFIHLSDVNPIIGSPGSYEHWDTKLKDWDYNRNKETGIKDNHDSDKLKDYLNQIYEPLPPTDSTSYLHDFDLFELSIIRELTKNSRRSQTEILNSIIQREMVVYENGYDPYDGIRDDFPSSKQTFSRRFNELSNRNVIMSNRLAFDRTQFGLFNQALFTMKNDLNGLKSLHEAIKDEVIPFPCALNANKDYIILWIHCPPIEIIKFSEILSERFQQVSLSLFGREPHAFFFYHLNYDPSTRYWKNDEEYVNKGPMDIINNSY